MKATTMKKATLILALLAVGAIQALAEAPKTLGEFKRQFLNKQVAIDDVPYQKGFCLDWLSTRQGTDGSFYAPDFNKLPIEYKGQTGTIIAIQLADNQSGRTTDAFGERVSEDSVTNPYMEVAVRFSDGQIGLVRGFANTLVPDRMELASTRESVRQLIESQLPAVVGRKLFAVGFSSLYKPTATIEEMSNQGGLGELSARLSPFDVVLLEPLTITKAKYLPDAGAVLLKLTLPNGSEAIAYTPSSYLHDIAERDFLSCISGSLLTSLPKELTAKEVEAIRNRTLFQGMSGDAVDLALGLKDSENDWGRGGKQRIYLGGRVVVYIDGSNNVEDWQTFQKHD